METIWYGFESEKEGRIVSIETVSASYVVNVSKLMVCHSQRRQKTGDYILELRRLSMTRAEFPETYGEYGPTSDPSLGDFAGLRTGMTTYFAIAVNKRAETLRILRIAPGA